MIKTYTPLTMKEEYPNDIELVEDADGNVISINISPDVAEKIQKFDCSYYYQLRSLPNLPNVEKLWAQYCSSLTYIPTFEKLHLLSVSFCHKLKTIFPQPVLFRLFCRYCPELNEIGDYKYLYQLVCSGCKNLKKIGEMPKLKEIDCAETHVDNLPPNEYLTINVTFAKNIKSEPNYKTDYVKTILQPWIQQGLVPYDHEKGYLFWKYVTAEMRGLLGFKYEVGKEFKNSGMACPGPFGALKDWSRRHDTNKCVMAIWAKSIYPVDVKRGVYYVLTGTPQAVYLAKNLDEYGFTPMLIQGEDDEGTRKVLG